MFWSSRTTVLCQLKNGPSHPIEFTDSKETNCQCIYTSVKLCARYKGKRTHSSQIDLQSPLGKLPHQAQIKAWKGAARQQLCSSFWLSNTMGTRWSGLWTERSFIWKPFRRPEKQSFPHQQSTQGRLGKEEQISRAAEEGWEAGAVWWWDY